MANERVARLEGLLGEAPAGENPSLFARLAEVERDLRRFQSLSEAAKVAADSRAANTEERLNNMAVILDEFVERIDSELVILKRAMAGSESQGPSTRFRVPEPKAFGGARNAKELENFVWDLEQYFEAARIADQDKVSVAAMYLSGDAKLWWRTRLDDDATAGRPRIVTWGAFSKELKDQFLPCNTAWVAREALKTLRQTGLVRDYVKQFSSLMLDIKDMSESDKLFNFLSGMQNWAQMELRRQGVKDLPSAMAAADALVDFRQPKPAESSSRPRRQADKPKSKGDVKGRRPQERGKARGHEAAKPQGCFICDGPHRARECPKREKLNTLVEEEAVEHQDLPTRVNPIQLLNSLKANPTSGLMHVPVSLHGVKMMAMLDTGATHNFLAQHVAEYIKAKVTTSTNRIKAVNSEARPVIGSVAGAAVEIGPWKAVMDFTVVPLDDFDVILGNEFFRSSKAMLMPYLNGMLLPDEKSSHFVQATAQTKGKHKTELLSALQLKDGVRKGDPTFLVTLAEVQPCHQASNDARGDNLAAGSPQTHEAPKSRSNREARGGLKGNGHHGNAGGKKGARSTAGALPTQDAPKSQRRPSPGEQQTGGEDTEPRPATAIVPAEILDVLQEFSDVMPPQLPRQLPPRRAVDHRIELLPGARAPAQAPYRMAPSELAELKKQLEELLDSGLIRPSTSPYGAPVLFQRKQDGSLRMCIDYRALNKLTVRDKYPVPLVQDLFDRLAKAQVFSKLDLRSGYWQVRIAEGDEAKTTCVTRYGAYEFLVMPFGLTNAPATFCHLMNDVLYDYLDKFVVVYLDDIVIYSESLEAHVDHMRQVLRRLREHSLFVKKEKCEFAVEEVSFLGHIIGGGRVMMDSKKVTAILEWAAPSKVPELRSFLGLANYYRRFIKGYSKKVTPLTDLLRKDHLWCWTGQCEEAFRMIKEAIAGEPVLRLPDFSLPFEVHTDASDRAIGGVLVQEGHPVAFESRKLNDAEQRYTAHEKEMVAVIHCLRTWRVYLLGTRFVVKTDNVANTYFQSQKKLSPKQARWQEFLQEYDFTWQHKPGRHNQVADALSRQQVQEYVAALVRVESDVAERIKQLAKEDAAYQKIVKEVQEGTTRRFWLQDGVLMAKGGRIFVPHGSLRVDLIKESHDSRWAGHPGRERTTALLSRRYYWPKMEEEIELYVKTCLVCQQDKTEQRKKAGLLQPLPIPGGIMQSISMDFITGLPKVDGKSMILVVVDRFSKYATFIPAPKGCPSDETAELFFKHVVKFFGLPKDIVSDRDGRFTGRFWTHLFKLMGSQLKFSTANHPQTDGQTERINALLEEFLRHYMTASQKNWLSLLDVAQFSYNLQRSSSTGKSPFELVLGYQPLAPHDLAAEEVEGCPAASRFAKNQEQMIEEAQESLSRAQRRMKKYADQGRRPLEFSEGDKVLLKLTPQILKQFSRKTTHKGLVPRYDGPFEVIKKVGRAAYRLLLPDRLKVHPTFHISFLKPYHEDLMHPERNVSKRAPPTIRVQFEKEAEAILGRRQEGKDKRSRRVFYLVKWKGQPEAEASWEHDVTLWQFEDLIQRYLQLNPTRASGSSGGGGLSGS